MTLLDQLQALVPLADAATPGPWNEGVADDSCDIISGFAQCEVAYTTNSLCADADAAFIARARNVLTPENLTLLVAGQQALAAAEKTQQLVDAATELLEVAALRGDCELPHPADDPKLWTARMQDAWGFLADAVAEMPAPVPVVGDTQWVPVSKLPAGLEEDLLYVLLPNNTVTQAMHTEFSTNDWEGYAWGEYTDIDCIDPLPVQPTHFFPPPVAPAR